MWKKYATPLRLRLRFSSRLVVIVWLGHALAALCLIPVALGLPYKMISWTAIAVSLWVHSRRLWFPVTPRALAQMIWEEGANWTLVAVGGAVCRVTMQPTWYLQRHLVILHFKGVGLGNRNVLLSEQRIGKEDFRRLRVRLRIEAAQIDS